MASWPVGWQNQVLRIAGIPVTQYGIDVLSAWQRSTPTEPWTNNPIGVPARTSGAPKALDTPYAAFTTIGMFEDTFKRFTKTRQGAGILHVLISGENLAAAWREIHKLRWPGSLTETDYPAALLDMVEEKARKRLMTAAVAQRKTAGTQHATPQVHAAMRNQGIALHEAATRFRSGSSAIRHIMKRSM